VSRRQALRGGLLAAGLGLSVLVPAPPGLGAAAGQTLHNSIRLPDPWPPRSRRLSREPVTPPYLLAPPAVIPIDLGRQLFVDDFLIEATTLRRTFHRAAYHPGNPVLRPDKPWERAGKDPTAMAFSDGVWYDPEDRLFVTRKSCQSFPLAESQAFGLARPDAGRMQCPSETLGKGKGERTAGKGRETATVEESPGTRGTSGFHRRRRRTTPGGRCPTTP
jgi:hypothetical protein